MSDVKHDYIQSRMTPMHELSPDDVSALFARLEAQAMADLRGDGFAADRIRIERGLDLRYAGQGYEITLPCPPGAMTADALAELRRSFDAQHRTVFGHSAPEEPVEVVSYRVTGMGLIPPVQLPRFKREGARSPTRSAPRGACASTARRWIARSISARSSTSASTSPGPPCSTSSIAPPCFARARWRGWTNGRT